MRRTYGGRRRRPCRNRTSSSRSVASVHATAVPRAIFLGGEGVHYEELAPPPELAPWVAVTWRLRSERATPLRVLPDGCVDIIGTDVVGSLSGALVADL